MADIVDLATASARRVREARPATGSAEIIIFPGVRIERWEQAPAPQAAKPRNRRARARDRIELPD